MRRLETQERRPIVFYVDDNLKSIRLLTAILQDCGFDVITANDPIEALALCNNYCFDLALVDYEMPIMSGARLVEELKFLVPDLPVVLLSGQKDIPKSDLVFVDGHFGPHTTLDDLLDKLRDLVKARSAAPANPQSMTSWSDAT